MIKIHIVQIPDLRSDHNDHTTVPEILFLLLYMSTNRWSLNYLVVQILSCPILHMYYLSHKIYFLLQLR